MSAQGEVVAVTEHVAGSELSATATTAGTLTVVDIEEFDLDGGTISIGTETRGYTVTTDTSNLVLASNLAGTYQAGEPVSLYPTVTERWCRFIEPDSEEELEARVPHSLYPMLPLGARTPDDATAEVVEAEMVESDLVVTDVLGRPVTGLDLEAADSDTPPDEDRVRWHRRSDGATVADIVGYDDGHQVLILASYEQSDGTGAGLSISAYAPDGIPAAISLSASAGTGAVNQAATLFVRDDAGGVVTKALLRGDGTSDFAFDTSGGWQSWTPTLSGWSVNPTNAVYRYRQTGKTVTLAIRQATNGTSNATTKTISLPSGLPAATITNMQWEAPCKAVDNGVLQATSGLAQINSADTTVAFFKDWAGTAWTNVGGHRIGTCFITYETT